MKHHSFLEKYNELINNNTSFVEVILIDGKGSMPQEIGARILTNGVDIFWGTIGGGKVEAHILKFSGTLLKEKQTDQTHKWNLQKDIGMTCGGEVSFYFHVFNASTKLEVAIFGAGHVAQALIRTLLPLNMQITCFDTRSEWIDKLPNANNLTKIVSKNLASEIAKLPDHAYVISITMGHSHDVPILNEALRLDFPYVGAIGSKSKRYVMEKELKVLGINEEKLKSLHCPIGEDFGDNTPAEIAISVAAQLLKMRDHR